MSLKKNQKYNIFYSYFSTIKKIVSKMMSFLFIADRF